LCERIQYGFRKEYEAFLRDVLKDNPHPGVQAAACLGLAHYLANRAGRLEILNERADAAKEFGELFGDAYLAELRAQDRPALDREIDALLERAVTEFGAQKTGEGEPVAVRAGAELFERRHLSVGKEAPDIDGEDQDGVRFKLSDYRGKVVLLDFWSRV
jgi:hypothetical protein